MVFRIESPVFNHADVIPRKYTCEGDNLSPPLRWFDTPKGTKSFVLICDDPDAPMMTWIHWVAYSIPGETTELNEGLPRTEVPGGKIMQGRNSSRGIGYDGPCPPGRKQHRYFFRLFALDSELNLRAGESRNYVERAMKGHVLASAELMGLYGRGDGA